MTKIKTRDLEGVALNWAVAEASKLDFFVEKGAILAYQAGADIPSVPYYDRIFWMPSINWSQGGPIVEREKMTCEWTSASHWRVCIEWLDEPTFEGFGPTLLVAAMRCYVMSKIGEEIDIPAELIGGKP